MAKEFKMSQARYDELKQELDYSKTTRGKALMGHKAGEEVAVEAPRGVIRYRIDKIER